MLQKAVAFPLEAVASPLEYQANRNSAIDLARLFGAFGIVWFHAKAPGSSIGYSALQLFMTLTILFSAKTGIDITYRQFLLSRFTRLIVPWLAWSVIFGAAKIIDSYYHNIPFEEEFMFWMFLTGPAIHLWFLPYVFCLSLLFLFLDKQRDKLNYSRGIIPIFVTTNVFFIYILNTYEFSIPFAQWLYVFPAAFLGWAMHLNRNSTKGFYLLSLSIIAPCGAYIFLDMPLLAEQFLIGGLLSIIVTKWRWKEYKFISKLSSYSLGIYLIHPPIFSVLQRTMSLEQSAITLAILGISLSITICLVLSNTKIRKILF